MKQQSSAPETPVTLTGIFLYQLKLAEWKGWPPALMASGFLVFAITRIACSIGVGPWVDRVGAARLFPYSLVPLALGIVLLWTQLAPWALFVFFLLAGVSQGIASMILTALWAQRYPAEVLGRVKSIIALLVVVSTACSPVLFGWLLASGHTFNHILPAAALLCLLSIGTSYFARRFGIQNPE